MSAFLFGFLGLRARRRSWRCRRRRLSRTRRLASALHIICLIYSHMHINIYIYTHDPRSAFPPPSPPPPPPPLPPLPPLPPPNGSPFLWRGGLLPPLPVVWCGPEVGLLGVASPLLPCGMVWVRVFLRWFPPCVFGSALGVW